MRNACDDLRLDLWGGRGAEWIALFWVLLDGDHGVCGAARANQAALGVWEIADEIPFVHNLRDLCHCADVTRVGERFS